MPLQEHLIAACSEIKKTKTQVGEAKVKHFMLKLTSDADRGAKFQLWVWREARLEGFKGFP